MEIPELQITTSPDKTVTDFTIPKKAQVTYVDARTNRISYEQALGEEKSRKLTAIVDVLYQKLQEQPVPDAIIYELCEASGVDFLVSQANYRLRARAFEDKDRVINFRYEDHLYMALESKLKPQNHI